MQTIPGPHQNFGFNLFISLQTTHLGGRPNYLDSCRLLTEGMGGILDLLWAVEKMVHSSVRHLKASLCKGEADGPFHLLHGHVKHHFQDLCR